MVGSSLDLVLEALENEVALYILELFDLLLVLELIVLHGATHVMR